LIEETEEPGSACSARVQRRSPALAIVVERKN